MVALRILPTADLNGVSVIVSPDARKVDLVLATTLPE